MACQLAFLNNIPNFKRQLTFSTLLTIVRFCLAPFVVYSMMLGYWGAAFWLFIVAALTDILDGFFARLWHQQTFLGACLDPIADKVLILSVFFTLAYVQTPLFTLPLWFVVLVLVKEFVQIGGALGIYLFKGSLTVRPTMLGKITMLLQTLFIIWLFACYFFNWLPVKTYYLMLGGLLFFVAASCFYYGVLGVRQVMNSL